jgi:fumarate hydratase class II
VLQSIRLLSDAVVSLTDRCIVGIKPNIGRIGELMEQSLMLVTALVPHIGYDKAAQIAQMALRNDRTLREQAIASGFVTEEEFNTFIRPEKMIRPE